MRECEGGNCSNFSYIDFKVRGKYFERDNNNCLVGHEINHKDLNLTSFLNDNTKDQKEVYVRGDRCNPDFYLFCTTKSSAQNPSCNRWFNYKDDIIVKYSYNKMYLKDYQLIHNNIIKIIDSFLVKVNG